MGIWAAIDFMHMQKYKRQPSLCLKCRLERTALNQLRFYAAILRLDLHTFACSSGVSLAVDDTGFNCKFGID